MMKLWEAMRLLEEDPAKVCEANQQCKGLTVRMRVDAGFAKYFKFEVFNGARLIDQSLGGGAFNGNVALGLDWQIVRQPITWQEAIQAWADGKKVAWEEDTDVWEDADRRVFDRKKSRSIPKYQNQFLDQDGEAVMVRMISGGEWYVED